MKLKKTVLIITIVSTISLLFGCSFFSNKGTLSLSLTDAPIADSKDVEGVFITITKIQYNLNGEWIDDTNFESPQTYNLLDLTNGTVEPLSNVVIDSGKVSQIRFLLDSAQDGKKTASISSNCYIIIDSDGTAERDGIIEKNDNKYPLFVPSGDQTGYKAVGEFIIPSNGTVEITADFDVRKSVIKKGNIDSHDYSLKPTIRLIANNQAGSIKGSFSFNNIEEYNTYTIFAYESGEYNENELSQEGDNPTYFENAISSSQVVLSEEGNNYILPFLAQGNYDLIITGVDDSNNYHILDDLNYTNIEVESEKDSIENISISIPL